MLDMARVERMLKRAETELDRKDYELLRRIADSYAYIAELAREPDMTSERLRARWLEWRAQRPEG